MYINEDKNCRCLSATKVRIARAIMDLHTNAEHLNAFNEEEIYTAQEKKSAEKSQGKKRERGRHRRVTLDSLARELHSRC